jgi:hypothetical protein
MELYKQATAAFELAGTEDTDTGYASALYNIGLVHYDRGQHEKQVLLVVWVARSNSVPPRR